ncbi:MAG: N-acetyltransferase [Desulfobacterales bacterium]|nr:MAG: N-acetyltransferase [Desulfobacterales bacterium]
MDIREATIEDAEDINKLYLQAFDDSESGIVSDIAVNLLKDDHPVKTISLVAIEDNKIVGHIAFSPVFLASTDEHFGYILSPLAVSPQFQKNQIGSTLVRYGLENIANKDSLIVFVYGDPQYYSRFGFKTDLALNFKPPYTLQFPQGWQAIKLNSAGFPEGGKLKCVASLNDPDLW